MNKYTLGLIIFFSLIIFPFSLWIDPILWGGTWDQYVMPCAVELICFICGILIGRMGAADE